MTHKDRTYQLFNPSGCLTREALMLYLRSELREVDAEKAKAHLDECELCKDAFDGLSLLNDIDQADDQITSIQFELTERLEKMKPVRPVRLSTRGTYLAAAASVIILIGLLFFLTREVDLRVNKNTAQDVSTEKPDIPPMPEAKNLEREFPEKENISEESSMLEEEPDQINKSAEQRIAGEQISPDEKGISTNSNKITPMKIRKTDESPSESLLFEKLAVSEDELPDTASPEETDIASVQPVEYYLGEVVVYNNSLDQMNSDKTISRSTKKRSNLKFDEGMSTSRPTSVTHIASAPEANRKAEASTTEKDKDRHFFTLVDQMPQFPGGTDALQHYLSENIQYPSKAARMDIQGTVVISFIVEKDGSITSSKVIRGIGGGCDAEALRVVASMPGWQPALKDGHPMRVLFTLPVTFRLH